MNTSRNIIYHGDNMDVLPSLADGSVQLIYIDPPFNTGRTQARTRIKTVQDDNGDRTGFQGKRYKTLELGTKAYDDAFKDFEGFLRPRLIEARRILSPTGSLFFHIDCREAHYCKILLDGIFGRESFINEIIWAYDYGGRSQDRWPAKHDTIFWYAKDPAHYTFNYDEIDRIPYLAPSLVGAAKAERGKTPTDVWWHTIVPTNGKEKTGYPTQKPLGIMNRIIRVHSNPGDTVLDFFAGSGTTGEAAARNGRNYILVDNNQQSIGVMKTRLKFSRPSTISRSSSARSWRKHEGGPHNVASSRVPVKVIAVGVSDYDTHHFPPLRGPQSDLDLIKGAFDREYGEIGLFDNKDVCVLRNPSLDEVRKELLGYTASRSAKGDILVFYFAGHGCVVHGTEFAFCFKDAQSADGAPISLSVLCFSDLLQTLLSADVRPVIIVDACFSSASIQHGDALKLMQESATKSAASEYAFFCSCSAERTAEETSQGGTFTRSLRSTLDMGVKSLERQDSLSLSDISKSVIDDLRKQGISAPKIYVGPDFNVPLFRNRAFIPSKPHDPGKHREETFAPYMAKIIKLLWNCGDPREKTITQIAATGAGAYGNHNKLALPPWDLVEKGSSNKHRKLTDRGKQFASGRLNIPRKIRQEFANGPFVAAPNTDMVGIRDL